MADKMFDEFENRRLKADNDSREYGGYEDY